MYVHPSQAPLHGSHTVREDTPSAGTCVKSAHWKCSLTVCCIPTTAHLNRQHSGIWECCVLHSFAVYVPRKLATWHCTVSTWLLGGFTIKSRNTATWEHWSTLCITTCTHVCLYGNERESTTAEQLCASNEQGYATHSLLLYKVSTECNTVRPIILMNTTVFSHTSKHALTH